MLAPLKAIETAYHGYRFRSRLEARWAVFFDTLGVRYEYELEGFDLGSNGKYLPDFWVPSLQSFVEIKPEEPNEEEKAKAGALADQSGHPVVIVAGSPGVERERIEVQHGYFRHEHVTFHLWSYFGYHMPTEDCNAWATWTEGSRFSGGYLQEFLQDKFPDRVIPAYDGTRASVIALIELDREYFQAEYDRPHPHWKHGLFENQSTWKWNKKLTIDYGFHSVDPEIGRALDAARAARFEFGESGR